MQKVQAPTEIVVDPPKPKSNVVVNVADFGARPGKDHCNGKAFADAIARCGEINAGNKGFDA